ncbi:MAG: SEC-C metal-binding domain-containing protein, partial [Chloroflexota bacterium]
RQPQTAAPLPFDASALPGAAGRVAAPAAVAAGGGPLPASSSPVGRAGGGAVAAAGGALAADPMARAMRETTNGAPTSPGGTKPGFTPSGERIGRNDACYCGSGLKYKKCHGR